VTVERIEESEKAFHHSLSDSGGRLLGRAIFQRQAEEPYQKKKESREGVEWKKGWPKNQRGMKQGKLPCHKEGGKKPPLGEGEVRGKFDLPDTRKGQGVTTGGTQDIIPN